MNEREPIEEFKRALTQTMRSIAEEAELTVTFGSETPSLNGLRARLPQPARDLDPADRQNVRGQSDSFALRLAHHDETVNAQMMPRESEARIHCRRRRTREALGARDMKGIAAIWRICTKRAHQAGLSRQDDPRRRAGFRSTGIYGARASPAPPATRLKVWLRHGRVDHRTGRRQTDNLPLWSMTSRALQM